MIGCVLLSILFHMGDGILEHVLMDKRNGIRKWEKSFQHCLCLPVMHLILSIIDAQKYWIKKRSARKVGRFTIASPVSLNLCVMAWR
ncbi:hypothetical protein F4806DRAFT_483403 [Annulohypoxylon nitens]|nr:hypothetical protein F4806DRAFT_483403 [Annulohypoxylon nitens]